MTTDFNPEQSANARGPMLVTVSDMLTDVRPMHPQNTSSPMLVTDEGITMDINLVQS